MARVDDYLDVIKLAYQTEAYWQHSKIEMIKGHNWYNLAVPISTPKGVEFCLAPGTPVLTKDLRWIRAETVSVGDELLAFDEYPLLRTEDGSGLARNKRSWRSSTVLAAESIVRPSYRISLEDGSEVIASAEHLWLVRTPEENRLEWIKTCDLDLGRHRLMKLLDVWDDQTLMYERGYLAGTLDGEGWLTQPLKENGGSSLRIGFAQRENGMASYARACLEAFGFSWAECPGESVIQFNVKGRRHEVLRLLGTIRPKRLMKSFSPEKLGVLEGKEYIHIRRLDYLGERPVVALGTTTKTIVANGFASHNSVPPTAASLVNDSADHLAGNNPTFQVQPVKPSQKSNVDRDRIQGALNGLWSRLSKQYGKALHRTLAMHGGWSGMMCARVMVRENWNFEAPSWRDLVWQPVDPRYVFPDPGSLGGEFVIFRMRRTVGSVRQMWGDWEGEWYEPGSSDAFIGQNTNTARRLPERLPDTAMVDWIEYWDDEVKCYIANGHPVFRQKYGRDIIPHLLGCNPFIIRAAGYGNDTGEAHERFRSMLYSVFHLLEAEARLLVQLKWIVEDIAWPTFLAPKSMKGVNLIPGTVNFVPDPEAIKAFKAVREDAVQPRAITDLLDRISGMIERATYPVVINGQAPRGITAGYPIAILSTQAKLKFAAPSDALQDMMQELANKTLKVIESRIQQRVECLDGNYLEPEDHDKYLGRISAELEPSLPQDKAALLGLLEFAVGSLGLPKTRALVELGFDRAEDLRSERVTEDLEDDPRVRQLVAEHFMRELSPEYADAMTELLGPSLQQQQTQTDTQTLQAQLQEMQTQLQYIQMLPQVQQAMAQMQQMQAGGGAPPPPQMPGQPGAPGLPGAAPAPVAATATVPPGGRPPVTVPGAPGGTQFGQNLGNPNNMGQSLNQLNPLTALSEQYRNLRSLRGINDMAMQNDVYGTPEGSL